MEPVQQKPEPNSVSGEPTQPDDVEILEIVGMSDEAPAPAAGDDAAGLSESAAEGPSADAATREAEERLLRLRADFENFRKRIERERAEHSRYATAALVERLLPVLDNLERALASVRPGASADSLAEGVALTQRQLVEELRREGLTPVEALGRPFDPEVHEAVAAAPSGGAAPNTVVEEFQRGYYFGDRLLRPALVRVAVGAVGAADRGESGEADG